VSQLRYSQRAQHAKHLIDASLAAVDPASAVRRHLQRDGDQLHVGGATYDLSQGHVLLVAAGKAARTMGTAAADVLGHALSEGVLIGKRESPAHQPASGDSGGQPIDVPAHLRLRYAGHPVPDQVGVSATAEVVEMLQQTTSQDLVLCLISGGASALLTQPTLPLDGWQRLVDALLASGCTINELNAVRKRMDLVKGGGLARMAAPAACASLILSDVVGNPLDIIGSGPTVANPDDPELPERILRRYGVADRLPPEDWQAISQQLRQLADTAQPPPKKVHNVIIGDVRLAAEAAVSAAAELGFDARLLTAHLEGEAREVGRVAGALAKDAAPDSCLVLGGETTVTVRGDGLGGRNLEVALAAAMALEGWPDRAVVTFATDGDDGPTSAAGALVDGQTLARARQLGLEAQCHLDNNDSYPLLEATGSLIVTGQTGTNVNDLLLLLTYSSQPMLKDH
jgi:hydroxypyruvate reductase